MNNTTCRRKWATRLAVMAGIVFPAAGALAAPPHSGGSNAIHWGYSGDAGPSHWGVLDRKYALCKSGKRQSPVDLQAAQDRELYPLRFHYNAVPLQAINNGHTLQANYFNAAKQDSVVIGGKSDPLKSKSVFGSELMLGDVSYKLLQFHFHTPSEHAHEGERYAMEVHLVHRNANGNLAVVGVFLKRGEHNATLQKVLDHTSNTVNEVTAAAGITVNAAALLPEDRRFYHYSGSLTTPPCSENVNWFVMKTPVEVSDQQVRRFSQLIGENARPLQDKHWRTLFGSL